MQYDIGEQNKKFLLFNYYLCKVPISVAQGKGYIALNEFLMGLKNFTEYTNNVINKDKWSKSLKYYDSRLKIISKNKNRNF